MSDLHWLQVLSGSLATVLTGLSIMNRAKKLSLSSLVREISGLIGRALSSATTHAAPLKAGGVGGTVSAIEVTSADARVDVRFERQTFEVQYTTRKPAEIVVTPGDKLASNLVSAAMASNGRIEVQQ